MNRWIQRSVLFAAAAAVPLCLPSSAQAQYRINEDGRALDASNRIGSGGANPHDSYRRVGEAVSGNDIVTGNVTGGKHFRGRVDHTDPRAFRGNTAGINLDSFIRQSSGPDARLAEEVRPFYGAGRAVPPPPNYIETSVGSGAYVPGPPVHRAVGDVRGGAVDLGMRNVALPNQGDMVLAGQVDPTAGQMFITASPTSGIRTFSANEITGLTSNTQYNPPGTKLDQNLIQQMRDELNREAGITTPGANSTGGAAPTEDKGITQPGAGTGAGAVKIEGAVAVTPKPITGGANQSKPLDTAVTATTPKGPDQGITNRPIVLPTPEKQSTVYASLLKQYQESMANPTATDEEKSRAFNQLQQQASKEQTAAPGATPGAQASAVPPGPGAAPGQPNITGAAPAPGATPPGGPSAPGSAAAGVPDYAARGEKLLREGVPKDQQKDIALKKQPIKVPSLSEGMKGKQVTDVIKSAEQLMKDGKFTAALDRFDDAERVVPNMPMVNLGRAHAELGASYYARAESHLRDLFTSHPELLVAQYDLTNMLGEQRLQTLVRDLKEIAKKDQKEPRPLFLLSYIAYNTGREAEAEAYLDLADKRTGGVDPFYKLLRKNWSLPAKSPTPGTPPAPDANK